MTNQEFVQGLRELADLYERHPEMLVPNHQLYLYLPYSETPQRYAETVKALADGGTVRKKGSRDKDDFYFGVARDFAALTVEFNIERQALCKKVIKMKAVETWECPDSILGLGGDDAETV